MSDKKKNKKTSAEDSKKCDKQPKKQSLGKRILKISLWVFGGIFAILLLAVIFRDSLVKFGVTRIGSWLTGVEITMDSFDTSLSEGTLHLKGLQVANPQGFERPLMVDLDEVFVDLDPSTLLSKEIVIEEIRVSGLDVAAEFDKKSRFNVTTLTDNLQEHFPAEENPAKEAPAEEPAEDPTSKPAILIRNIDVRLSLSMIHDLSGVSFPLPVAYSTTDLRIAPEDDSEPLIEKLARAAKKLEEYCQACFNAGQLLLSAGDEAIEGLNAGLNAGIESGKVVIDQSKDLLNKGKGILDKSKGIFDTAGDLFKSKK
jgi:hypothetical protein